MALYCCSGCTNKKLVQPEDYEAYLQPAPFNEAVNRLEKEIDFWDSRLQQDTQSFVSLAELGYQHLSLFQRNGAEVHLLKSDSFFRLAASRLNFTDPELLQALSQVAITKHRFHEADRYNRQAYENDGSPYTHALLSFDVGMELGQYHTAKEKLNDLKDRQSFDFLIRQAKYLDHSGNLEGAIELMETAFAKVAHTNKAHLYCWALSNLADMYGHAGRIEEAYEAYLKVLEKEPGYAYALKGIAWIAYAHDNNPAEARRIIHFLTNHSSDPQLLLFLAELAAFENNKRQQDQFIDRFMEQVSRSPIKEMYHKPLIELFTEERKNLPLAQQLAEQEVAHRPTPETYSWLAWVHLKKGEADKAYQLYLTHVKGRSFEPELLLKGAYILEAAGRQQEARALFEECNESSFELGPAVQKELASRLD